MAGFDGLEADFVEPEGDGPVEHINLDAGQPKLPPRWRQIEMMREKRQLSEVLESYDEWDLDDSEE